MSGLAEAVKEAYERAERSCDHTDWMVFHALQAAWQAEIAAGHDVKPPDLSGIPTPAEAGYPDELHIERPDTPHDH